MCVCGRAGTVCVLRQVVEMTRQIVSAGPKFDWAPAELLDLHRDMMGRQTAELERVSNAAAAVRTTPPP